MLCVSYLLSIPLYYCYKFFRTAGRIFKMLLIILDIEGVVLIVCAMAFGHDLRRRSRQQHDCNPP